MTTLERVVAGNDKRRFSFSDDGRKVRANQGHSLPVGLGLEPLVPAETLYHGTAAARLDAVLGTGITPQRRLHVHLSPDDETARAVGRRHGNSVVLAVRAGDLHRNGHAFYRSANGVWLTTFVPPDHLEMR
ncbi:MAG TPA: RNA 2'-phosphotransferase [Egibacteraceae bacterium]|nr:RNA 2'-phosphotransferase [Egibacteraceae bacterium]